MALVPARALARPTSKTAVLALARPILARAPPATIILLTAIVPEAVPATLQPPRAEVALRQPRPTRQSATLPRPRQPSLLRQPLWAILLPRRLLISPTALAVLPKQNIAGQSAQPATQLQPLPITRLLLKQLRANGISAPMVRTKQAIKARHNVLVLTMWAFAVPVQQPPAPALRDVLIP